MKARARYAAVATLLSAVGCMAFPQVHFHDYEGEVAPNPILAVEDGRRVQFAQLTVTKNEASPWNVHPQVVLVEHRATPTTRSSTLPIWTGRRQLDDQTFLRQCLDDGPIWRCPIAVRDATGDEPSLIAWDDGYVVATRPFTVAYASDAHAFEIAQNTVARRRSAAQPTTPLPPLHGNVSRPLVSPVQQYNFGLAWVEPIALAERVDTLQILADAETLRVVRLDAPITIDALFDLLASPGGIEPHVAEDVRQARPMSDLERAMRERDATAIPRL